MKRLISFFKTHFLAFILAVLAIGVSAANYTPGTWLLGWDNLVPEFDFPLNIERSVFSAWQEYQGLGLAAGMAHGATLFRELLLWGISSIVPAHFMRYLWTFVMLMAGPVGVYALFVRFFPSQKSATSRLAGFVAGLFYLFNMATVQNFYTPFETFSSFYGFLPWLLWAGLEVFRSPTRKSKLIYFFVSLLATSAFQVQTLFVVYVLVSALFATETFFKNKQKAKAGLKSWVVLTLAANAFWLVPVVYFTLFHSQINVLAKQNQLSTPELRIMNQNFGTLENVTALQGFWFDYLDSTIGKYHYLLGPWREYLAATQYPWLGRILFGVAFLGFVGFVARQREKRPYAWSWLGTAVLAFLALSAGAGFFGGVYTFAEQYIPLFSQIFRATFTKWSQVMALLISVGLGLAFLQYAETLKKGRALVLLPFCAAILVLAPPFFQGKLISHNMRIQLPAEYQELFAFFKDRPRARIALLPANNAWSWSFHTWRYRGSGFLWYGIQQPILDRAFDVFSAENENFYHQFSESWQRRDAAALREILQKYRVGYVVADESVVSGNGVQTETIDEAQQLLAEAGYTEIWHEGSLAVFEEPQQAWEAALTAPPQLDRVRLIDTFQAKREYSVHPFSFITPSLTDDKHNSFTTIYPLAGLTGERLNDVWRSDGQGYITKDIYLVPNVPYVLVVPALRPGAVYNVPVRVALTDDILEVQFARPVRIEVGGEGLDLPDLGKYELELSDAFSEVLFAVNEQSIAVSQGEVQELSLQLEVNQPVDISVNEILGRTDEGGVFINTVQEENFTISISLWQPVLSDQHLSIAGSGETTFQVRFPLFLIDLLPVFQDLPTAESCDLFGRGEVQREIAGTSLTYIARNAGTSCESVYVGDVSPGASYVLFVEGENLSGRGPRIIFSGADKNFFYLEDLPQQPRFQQAYAILPQQNLESGYFVNLETKSFGREESRNRFDVLEAAQLPLSYDFLSRIVLIPEGTQPLRNTVEISDIKQWGTAFYSVKINVTSEIGIITLNQSYDAGWAAFSMGNRPGLLKHFQYNNWANAWEAPQGMRSVLIVYWPQLGVFAGFILLVGTGAWLLVSRVSSGGTSE